ncbi:MAG: CHASE3 domain-containing protein [Labilithrix sp.]|nr:CHASE3 domain-containing protein [Labilithrix sp.]
MWTFGRKLAVGFALPFILLLVIGIVGYRSVTMLTTSSYAVSHTHMVLERIATLLGQLKDAETGQRGFVITGDESFLEPYERALGEIDKTTKELRELVSDNAGQRKRLAELEPLINSKLSVLKRTLEVRRSSGFEAASKLVEGGEGKRTMDEVRRIADQIDREERDLLKQRAEDVESAASTARATMVLGTTLALLLVLAAAVTITRSLTSQIGAAVKHVQSSSTELHAAANQQVSGAKEQATAMNEITTTMNELLATSRQIAESSQRVVKIADQAGGAALGGDRIVKRTQESVGGIRRQVDVIVTHMLELGKTSQQIGGILEIINELAEQTNILAINATIEAAGAGEAGKRFGVVADEIRKLADRVGGSTKEIRKLVDDIRAAVNTTVMATEGGSKAVDAGARDFSDAAASFAQIVALVTTTADAAKEIELSTKQQATAVEQVNVAVANVAQAARETEAGATQTFQTSSQLTTLSRELSRMIQPEAAA